MCVSNVIAAPDSFYSGEAEKSGQVVLRTASKGKKISFSDVTNRSDYWYAPVYWGAEKGIVGGYPDGTFRPDNECTRAQMVTFLWRMAGTPEPKLKKNPFKDVTDTNAYYYKAMLWGAEKGIVGGYKLQDGTQEFRPENVCTRQQAVTFLWRLAGMPEPEAKRSQFKDVQDKNQYYFKAVLWASENDITGGYSDNTFRPTGNCFRRQLVTFLYRYDQNHGKPINIDLDVIIGDYWSDPDEEPQTDYDKAFRQLQNRYMKKYNYTVMRTAIASWGEFNEGFYQLEVLSDEPDASVYVLDRAFTAEPMDQGLCYDLATLYNLDLSDEKWNQNTIRLMTRGSHVYGLSIGNSEPRTGVFFNKKLLKQAGYSENYLYDLQKNGKWTWAEFEKVCKACTKDTDGDGVLNRYATASFAVDFFGAVTASDGEEWIKLDKNGHYVNNTTSSGWTSAMNWGVGMIQKYELPQPEDSQWDWFIDAFKNGQVAMTVAEEYKVANWQDMKDDWGFVVFPRGPHMDHYVMPARDDVFVIPASFSREKAEKIAFVLDKWADPVSGYDQNKILIERELNTGHKFRDERAVKETLVLMTKPGNQSVDYSSMIPGIDAGEIIFPVYGKSGDAPSDAAAAVKIEWDKRINDANKKF